jgi:glycosyltransferase involved in cell wall biosynthesis
MKKIIFIANNNLGNGLSGGDRIFLEFLRTWQNKANITVFACQETINLINSYKIPKKIKIIKTTSDVNTQDYFNILKLVKHTFKRTWIGIRSIYHYRKSIKYANVVYSVSDFYPDFFPAFLAKIINPKIKWIVGYYLFAPNPFSKKSPYQKTNFTKGLFYWLIQRPTHLITNLLANIVFITSKPDEKNFPYKKTLIIRGGVDTNPAKKYFKNKKNTKKIYDAVFIGRFHPQKGILELIDIWKLVVKKKPKSKLAIIGDGELETKMRQKISKFKLEKNIEILGFLDGNKKYQVFRQSKIVLHPATYDSGGMAAAEAMAWGLPGVSFDLESLKTYYPKGMIKTKCFNFNIFVKNIFLLLENKKTYQKISLEAKTLIYQEWDWEKRSNLIYQKTSQFFNSAL